jgi:hypothetical protein
VNCSILLLLGFSSFVQVVVGKKLHAWKMYRNVEKLLGVVIRMPTSESVVIGMPSVVFRMPTSESVVIGMPSVALRMPTSESVVIGMPSVVLRMPTSESVVIGMPSVVLRNAHFFRAKSVVLTKWVGILKCRYCKFPIYFFVQLLFFSISDILYIGQYPHSQAMELTVNIKQ